MTKPTRAPDASMTLITEMMQRPLDLGYADAAERRVAEGLAPSTGITSPLIIAAAVVLGLVLSIAALTLRPSGTTASRDKALLIDQIHARQDQSDNLGTQLSGLREEIQRYQGAALGSEQPALADELVRLSLLTGDVGAGGPGLVLTVDDAADVNAVGGADPRGANGFSPGRVTSLDLQVIANGLWEAGAEAISINGQRLTARSAIRFAGEAILVDYRPLTPPYALTVIGDPTTVQTRFAVTTAGSYLKALADNYKIRSDVKAADRVTVPRNPSLELLFAQPVSPDAPSSSATSAPGGLPSPTSPPLTRTSPPPTSSERTP